MKLFTGLVVLLMAGSAAAHNSCDFDLHAGVRITDNSIEFYDGDESIYKVIEDQYLEVKGKAQKLTQAQQQLVVSYAASIRAAVPEVQGLALDGIDLAIEGVTLAFDSLLGEKNKISTQLMVELTNLKSDVKRHFSSGNPISFNRGGDGDTPDFLGKQFETRLERIVDTSVQDSMGSLMVAVGKEIFASAGNMETFEQRMSKFGEELEAQMNLRATKMESHGKKLCHTMMVIDGIEEQLKQSIPAVEPFNIIQLNMLEGQVAWQKI